MRADTFTQMALQEKYGWMWNKWQWWQFAGSGQMPIIQVWAGHERVDKINNAENLCLLNWSRYVLCVHSLRRFAFDLLCTTPWQQKCCHGPLPQKTRFQGSNSKLDRESPHLSVLRSSGSREAKSKLDWGSPPSVCTEIGLLRKQSLGGRDFSRSCKQLSSFAGPVNRNIISQGD